MNRVNKKPIIALAAVLAPSLFAQATGTQPQPASAAPATDDEVIVLSPFEVTASESNGYVATTTLAGSRINTQLKDVGSAISVVTSEFLKDTGATDSKTLLQYTTSTEVASIQGNFTKASSGNQMEEANFTSPNTNTRVRGLTSADNTRGFFMTDIPWDAYNVDRVDMQRGPNSILFGMGSPAGIINTTTKTAQFRNFGELELRYGSNGANRVGFDYNHALLEDELALRVNLVRNDEKYKQKPAYSLDRRIFVTGRYEPKFLSRGDHKTSIKVNYESGSIRSNNPRVITPIDMITPWFNNMNQATYNPANVHDNQPHYTYDSADNVASVSWLTGVNGPVMERTYGNYIPVGQPYNATAALSGGTNAAYQPWLTNVASIYESGVYTVFTPGTKTVATMMPSGFGNTLYGRSSTGAVDAAIGGLPGNWQQPAVAGTTTYANQAGIKYSEQGLWKNATLSNSSVFDFYNNLIDGKNKSEWQNFHNFSASLSQTFFKQKCGFEFAYDESIYRSGQVSLVTDNRAGIAVDLSTTNLDGTPNVNVGKPYLADSGIYGNSDAQNNREASRFTAFFDHNFNEDGKAGWFYKLLGRHTVSTLYSQDMVRSMNRNFARWSTGLDFASLVTTDPNGSQIHANRRILNPIVYLSDTSLIGSSLANGLNIQGAGDAIEMPDQIGFRYFDSTWNAPSTVGFGDRYINPNTGSISTQSENPANYVGWRTVNVDVLDAKNAADRDALTFAANLSRKKSDSRAAVWQAYFWDGAVVGMYGIRRDNIKSWSGTAYRTTGSDVPADGHVDFNTVITRDGVTATGFSTVPWPYASTSVNTPSWSIVGHLTKLLGRWGDHIPVNVSFYYNTSSNFQVMGTRTNIYGDTMGLPSGKTLDRGITISTKDDRFSLRINKYESNVLNANNTSGLNTWLIGNNSDTLFTWGENFADRLEYNLNEVGKPATANTGNPDGYNYTPQPKADGSVQTAAEAAAAEVRDVAAWRALTATPQVQRFLKAFGYSDFGVTQVTTLARMPTFALSEDQVSKGWEFELTANPTRNWRISMNASKTTAQRSNIGGPGFAEFVKVVNDAMLGDAGTLRLWNGGSTNRLRDQWNGAFYSSYALMALQEGTNSPELRKWRFNVISNYDFTEGRLKGFNVGVGYRWQDKIAIGYRPVDGVDGVSFDLENPIMGPREDAIDFWIGYGKKLTEKIDWRIQLNIRNAFDGNKLIPLTAQPDGSVAAWRIAPGQTWQITSTFKF